MPETEEDMASRNTGNHQSGSRDEQAASATAPLTFKGTPGPWFWTEKNRQAVALMASGGKWVADPQCDLSDYALRAECWTDVSREDAALIAAAPDLLEVAQALVQVDDARRDVQKLYERACQLARAAIAKATIVSTDADSPLPEGFTPWFGGKCPVPGTRIDWINANGDGANFFAEEVSGWDWHDPKSAHYRYRIVGYRVTSVGGEAVHGQVVQPIRDEPSSSLSPAEPTGGN